MLYGWGVKAGMVRVWVTGKAVWSYCYTQVISERFRDKELIYKALYKFSCLLIYSGIRTFPLNVSSLRHFPLSTTYERKNANNYLALELGLCLSYGSQGRDSNIRGNFSGEISFALWVHCLYLSHSSVTSAHLSTACGHNWLHGTPYLALLETAKSGCSCSWWQLARASAASAINSLLNRRQRRRRRSRNAVASSPIDCSNARFATLQGTSSSMQLWLG